MYQYPGQMGMAQPMQNQVQPQMYSGYGQSMQQGPNFGPQTPVTAPQTVPQGNYTPIQQIGMKVRPVASYDEAKAVPTDFMGNILVLTDLSHGCIYTKVLDPNTGSSVFQVYQRVPEQVPQPMVQPQAPVESSMPAYDAKAEIENLRGEVNRLKHELGLDKEEAQ